MRKRPDLDNFFRGVKVTAFPQMILRYVKNRREAGIQDSTICRHLAWLRAMCRLAVEHDRIPKMPPFPKLNREGKVREGFVNPEQFDKILAHLPEHLVPFFQFLYGTGCRLGAAQKLTWGMISKPPCDVVHLPGHITKNGKPYALPLAGPLAHLQPLFRDMLNGGKKDNTPVFDTTNFRDAWSMAVAAAGFGTHQPRTAANPHQLRTGLTIHDLRRSAARNLRNSGVDESVCMKITGHQSTSMFKRYAIVAEDELKNALVKVENYSNQRKAVATNLSYQN
jgi:integrase